ncbi:MAG: hypothetical protein HQL94_08510 [Magnetococcales bacterium]|nr:hypothetical protein [Magnetococcales bacterium]
MKALRKAWFFSLMLLIAPLSVVWGAEKGKENPQIAKTASKVKLPMVAALSQRATKLQKDKEAVRKIVLAKKMQKKGGKKSPAKKGKGAQKKGPPAKNTATIPAKMGIRTWTFPETAPARTNKITELSVRIKETENAYDAENAKFQKLNKEYLRLKETLTQSTQAMEQVTEPQNKALENYRKAQEMAMKNPQISVEAQRKEYLRSVEQAAASTAAASKTIVANSAKLAPIEAQLATSQRRLNEIMAQLDALHQHRNEVSDIVFLRTVKD